MTSLGKIFIDVEIDESGFDSGLSSLNQKTEQSGGFLKNALSFATGGAILGGLNLIKDGILGVAGSMVSGNAEFERYETQFGVLLGSADAAKQRLQELAAFGASTPFELPELVQADKVLQSFGIHSQEMLTIVGDVAAGTGASFQDMALLMGKFSAGATGEAISRFAELGITTRAELASLGLEFSKSGELLSPLPQAMEVVQGLMAEKFGGMMTAQSQTFEGMMSNLADWKDSTLRTLGAPIFEVVKDKLAGVLEFLNKPETMAAMTAFAEALADGIGSAMNFLSNTAIPALISAWNTIQPAIEVVRAAFVQAGDGSGVLGQALTFLGTVWNQLSQIIDVAAKLIQAIVPPVFNFISAFLQEHGDTILTILGNTWNAIKAAIDIALTLIKGVLTAALQIIQGDWSGAWETIKDMSARIVEDIWTIIKSGLDNLLTLFGTSVDDITNTMSELPGRMVSIGTDIIDGIVQGVQNAAGRLYSSLRGIAENALQAAKDAVGISSPSKDFDEQVGQPIILGILQGLRTLLPNLMDFFSTLGKDMLEKVTDISKDVKDIFNDLFEGGLSGNVSLDRAQADTIDKLQAFKDKTAKILADPESGMSVWMRDTLQLFTTSLEDQLGQLQKQTDEMAQTDPQKAAAFYQLRKRQLFELAELQRRFTTAATEEERSRITAQMREIENAQRNELELFNSQQGRQDERDKARIGGLAEQIQKLMDTITDPGTDNKLSQMLLALYDLLVRLSATSMPASNGLLIAAPVGAAPGNGGGTTNINFYYQNPAPPASELAMLQSLLVNT